MEIMEIIKTLKPIQQEVAKKVYIENKSKQTIMEEIQRTKSTYYRIRSKISEKIRNEYHKNGNK